MFVTSESDVLNSFRISCFQNLLIIVEVEVVLLYLDTFRTGFITVFARTEIGFGGKRC